MIEACRLKAPGQSSIVNHPLPIEAKDVRMRFLPLVENEVLKLLKRRRFRVVLLILVGLIGLIVFAQSKGRERLFSGKDWRVRVQERVASMQNAVRSGRMPKSAERWTRFERSEERRVGKECRSR